MRSWVRLVVFLYGLFALVAALEWVFFAWWDVPDESLLPLMAAAAVVIAPLFVLRALRREPERGVQLGSKWAEAHPVYAAALGAAPLLVLSLVPALLGKETWAESLAWSFGGAGGLFVVLLAMGYVERRIRRREARKRGIQPADYTPGRLARGIGITLAVLVGLYLVLGLVVELSDVLD